MHSASLWEHDPALDPFQILPDRENKNQSIEEERQNPTIVAAVLLLSVLSDVLLICSLS